VTRSDSPARRAALLLGLALAIAPLPAAGAPKTLPDSTTFESWQLANGIRVVTLNIPRCPSVAITVGYPVGTDGDPAGRRGWAQLMAEVQMMAAAGDVPERTPDEMESLRPLGWSIKVGRRATQLSEVASIAQFPGALRQVATRMRGVTVDDAALKSAVATVRRDLGEHLFGTVDYSLYYQVRELAGGGDPNSALAVSQAKGLDGVTARDLEQSVHATFAPGSAVLALAGDLSGLNVHALVENQFGPLPAGAPPANRAADPAPAAFRPAFRSLARADVDQPVGVVAVQAPALTDTLHPRFFLAVLLMAEHCQQSWNISRLVRSRFRYSILDEPDLVRFYPQTAPDSTDAHALATELRLTLGGLLEMTVVRSEYDELRYNVLWLLGGPMPRHVLAQVRTDGPSLNNLCNNLAARELTGGEAFWTRYRQRFLNMSDPGLARWARFVCLPEHQVGLLFTPLPKGRPAR
jgi:hypothetical protein